jgi:hypothetical protein
MKREQILAMEAGLKLNARTNGISYILANRKCLCSCKIEVMEDEK